MEILEATPDGAKLHFEPYELLLLIAIVEEGRISFECDFPVAEALERGIRSATIRVHNEDYRTQGEC